MFNCQVCDAKYNSVSALNKQEQNIKIHRKLKKMYNIVMTVMDHLI